MKARSRREGLTGYNVRPDENEIVTTGKWGDCAARARRNSVKRGVLPPRCRTRSRAGREPVRAHGVENPGRLCPRHDQNDYANSRWVSLVWHGIWLVSLRWRSDGPLAAARECVSPEQYHSQTPRSPRW